MKRQIFYAILAYAGWLTYQDINGTLHHTELDNMQPLLRQAVADQIGNPGSISAYRSTPRVANCIDPYACIDAAP